MSVTSYKQLSLWEQKFDCEFLGELNKRHSMSVIVDKMHTASRAVKAQVLSALRNQPPFRATASPVSLD